MQTTGKMSPDEKIMALNKVIFANLVPERDVDAIARAKATMNKERLQMLMDQYLPLYDKACALLDTPEDAETPVEAVEETIMPTEPAPAPKKPRKPRAKVKRLSAEEKREKDPDEYKAVLAYKKYQRTLKHMLLKEEVLLDRGHRCECCGGEGKLIVRHTLPVIKYIKAHRLFDVKAVIADPVINDIAKHTALCTDCKPFTFAKH